MENKKNELKKERRRLILKRDGRYGLIFGSLFAIATTVVYFSIPNAAKGSDGEDAGTSISRSSYVPENGGNGLTPIEKFTSNLTGLQGLTAGLTLNATYPNNTFAVNATIAFAMPELSLNKIGLNLKANVNYNGNVVTVNDGAAADTLDVDMLNGDLYVSAMGINYKSTVDSRVDLMKNIIRIFSIESAQINLDTSSLSSSSTTSDLMNALSNMKEEDLSDGTYRFTLTVDGMNIVMTADKDCLLTGAYTDETTPIVFGDWRMGFALSNVAITDDITIVDPEQAGKTYLELNDSVDLIEKAYNVYKGKNVGISFDASLLNGTADLALTGGANVDFSGSNFLNDTLDLSLQTKYSYFAKSTDANKTSDTQSLAAVYTPEAAYLTYNDNAIRAKMSHSAMNDLIDSMKSKLGATETKSASSAFDFITTSPLMTDIYDGHYEKVISMLKKVETDDNFIKLTVSLDQLGLGASSEVTVTFDGKATATNLAVIAVKDLVLSSSVTLSSATFKTVDYSSANVTAAKEGTDYMSLDFASGVFNQMYDLVQKQKFGVTINDADSGTNGTTIVETGTTNSYAISGDLQADIPSKVGTGTVNIDAVSSDWTAGTSQKHTLTADLTAGATSEESKLLFSYKDTITTTSGTTGGDKPLNGDLSVASIEDMVSQVKSVVSPDAPDQRWAKFFDSMKSEAAATVIGRLMNKEYGALLESKILKGVSTVHNDKSGFDEVKAVVDGHLIGDDGHDIVVYMPLGASATNTDEVKGLRLADFVYGKYTINLDVSLKSYDDTKVASLVEDDSYLGLSSLKTLVKFGIKTSYLTSYHLTATAKLTFLLGTDIDIDINFYLSVVDRTVKVAGYFSNIPLLSLLNNDGKWAALDTLSTNAYRNVEFYYQAPESGGNGGDIYFYEYDNRPVSGNRTVYKKVYAPYFTSNILYYVLNDVVHLKSSYIDSITKKTDTTSTSPIDIESVLTSYSCTGESTTTPSFNLKMDMGVLANNSQLGDLDVTIGTNADGYLASLDVTMSFDIPLLNLSLSASVKNVDIGIDNWTGSAAKAKAADAWAAMVARTSFDSVEGY